MATFMQTLKIIVNLSPVRWSMAKLNHTILVTFNRPWNPEHVYDRKTLRRLADNYGVLNALADDD